MELLEQCPICKSSQLKDFLALQDWFLSNEKYKIVACKQCGFKFTNPRPSLDVIGQYYKSEDYISHSNTKKDPLSMVYQKVRQHTITQKYNMISSYQKTGKILDIGCATAEFLAFFKTQGWDVSGVEPDSDARAMALQNHDIEVKEETALDSFEAGSFNTITMWHVLEHVYPLNERIEQLYRLLAKDGTLVIAVPNCNSHDALYYKEHWAAYDVPRHIYHFAQKDIKQLFDNHGFVLQKVEPMKFDSFYVSLLSEKYKSGGSAPKAFIKGLQSNLSAAKTGEYSSLIYILKKK